MAQWTPIVLNAGSDKTCEFCGKPIKYDTSKEISRTADQANGMILDSNPMMATHANCLREVLVFASAQMKAVKAQMASSGKPAHAALEKALAAQEPASTPMPFSTLKSKMDLPKGEGEGK